MLLLSPRNTQRLPDMTACINSTAVTETMPSFFAWTFGRQYANIATSWCRHVGGWGERSWFPPWNKNKKVGLIIYIYNWSFSRCFYPKRIMQMMTFYLTFFTLYFTILTFLNWCINLNINSKFWNKSPNCESQNWEKRVAMKKGACFCHKIKERSLQLFIWQI